MNTTIESEQHAVSAEILKPKAKRAALPRSQIRQKSTEGGRQNPRRAKQ